MITAYFMFAAATFFVLYCIISKNFVYRYLLGGDWIKVTYTKPNGTTRTYWQRPTDSYANGIIVERESH